MVHPILLHETMQIISTPLARNRHVTAEEIVVLDWDEAT